MTTSPETLEARDPDAGIRVAALYEAHGRTVLGLCRFLLRDVTEAEDAAQQSFLSAYRSLLGGAVPREPAAWLAAIARNECWQRIKRRMQEPLMLNEVPSQLADPLEAAARNADFAALRAGLEALSRPQREVFMLREFAGLSYSELALALGVTEPAVDSLLFRARTSLRRALSAANGAVVPFAPVALRDQLARLIPGFDQPAVSALAKLASLPIAAKLAAVGAGAVLVVAGSAGLERHVTHARVSAATPVPAPRASRPAPAPSRPAVPGVEARPLRVSVVRATRVVAPASTRNANTPVTQPGPRASDPGPTDTDPSNTDPSAPAFVPTATPPPPAGGGGGPTFGGGGALPPEGTPGDPPTGVPTDGPTVEPTDSGVDIPGSDDSGSGSGSGSDGSGSGSDGSGSGSDDPISAD